MAGAAWKEPRHGRLIPAKAGHIDKVFRDRHTATMTAGSTRPMGSVI